MPHPTYKQPLDHEGYGQEKDGCRQALPYQQADGQRQGHDTAQGVLQPTAERTTYIHYLVLGTFGRAGVGQLAGDEGGGCLGGHVEEEEEEVRAPAAPRWGAESEK